MARECAAVARDATRCKAEYDAAARAKKKAIETFVAEADEQVARPLSPGATLPDKLETLYPAETKAELKKLRDELTQLQKNPPELPSAMGVTESQVADEAIHIRGNPIKLGDVVAAARSPAVRGPPPPQFSSSESGRRELAQWLIDPQHPLTGRVMVNRVWRWHFGAGLVRTHRQLRPARRKLRRIRSCSTGWPAACRGRGWSLKSLHRLMLSSSTYQQSSTPRRDDASRDPENRLFGRASVRRLEAEAVRDALLAVSGQLDRTMGGSLLKVKNRDYFFDHTSKDLTDYNSRRRSLYLPVVRNNVYDVFQLFDFPDPAIPSGDRATTTVAPQALLMLNSDLVLQARRRSGRASLSREAGTDTERLQRMYVLAYGRPPTRRRSGRRILAFLARGGSCRSQRAEADANQRRGRPGALCQTILASNEFVYVRMTDARLSICRRCSRAATLLRQAAVGFGSLALPRSWPTNRRGSRRRRRQSARAQAAALSRAGQAGHLPVHEGRAVARRYLRPQAAARRATTASRSRSPSRACSSPRPGNLLASPWKFEPARPERHRGSASCSRTWPSTWTTSASSTRSTAPTRPTAGRCSSCTPAATTSSAPASARGSPTAWAPRTRNLPGFITICPTLAHGGVNNWGSAFLPAVYQGTPLGNASVPSDQARVKYIANTPPAARAAAAAARSAGRDEPRPPGRSRPGAGARRRGSIRSSWPSACRRRCRRSRTSPANRRRRRSCTAWTTRSPRTSAGSACWPAASPSAACGSSRSRTATATCSGTSTAT